MLSLTVKGKESTFVVGPMTAYSVEKQFIESFSDDSYRHLTQTHHPQKSNSLDIKPSKRTLKSCDKDAEV